MSEKYMKSILVSVLGEDKPGLIDGLSEIILSYEGDWVESRMSSFEGKFAGIIKVNVPSKNIDKLGKKLVASNLGLKIVCEETKSHALQPFKSYNIELIGQNHTGIINKLSHALVALGGNVEEIKSEIIEASMSGEKLFKAEITLHIPTTVEEYVIRDQLEDIANEMMVEIFSYES